MTMTHRFVMIAAIIIVMVYPSALAPRALAQEQSDVCASEVWLESRDASDEPSADAVIETPSWMSAELIDACTGQSFTLAEFSGKVLYVEAMATWCPPCRDQLGRVREAMAQLPPDQQAETVVVALSSEVDLPREALAQYAADNGFPFIFAVLPVEVLQDMANNLGQEVAVAPATPHLIVGPDGSVGELRTGSTTPEDIIALLDAARAAPAS
jgi:thiol-disulfide isomerase/thioredoxin